MEINFSDFHFLRPLWLLLVPFAALLPILWRRSRDLQRRLRSNIAEHLLPHLLITPQDQHRLRPVHLVCAVLILGAVAAAGPTWEQDRPDFLENRAPLIIAIDLSPSMDANDVPPNPTSESRPTCNPPPPSWSAACWNFNSTSSPTAGSPAPRPCPT